MKHVEWTPLDLVVFDGMEPSGNGSVKFRMREGLVHCLGQIHPEFKLVGAMIPDIVASPAGVWMGLKRLGKEDGYCYSARPAEMLARHFPTLEEGFIVTVYADSDFEVFNFGIEREDREFCGFPVGHHEPTRFGRRTWPKSQ